MRWSGTSYSASNSASSRALTAVAARAAAAAAAFVLLLHACALAPVSVHALLLHPIPSCLSASPCSWYDVNSWIDSATSMAPAGYPGPSDTVTLSAGQGVLVDDTYSIQKLFVNCPIATPCRLVYASRDGFARTVLTVNYPGGSITDYAFQIGAGNQLTMELAAGYKPDTASFGGRTLTVTGFMLVDSGAQLTFDGSAYGGQSFFAEYLTDSTEPEMTVKGTMTLGPNSQFVMASSTLNGGFKCGVSGASSGRILVQSTATKGSGTATAAPYVTTPGETNLDANTLVLNTPIRAQCTGLIIEFAHTSGTSRFYASDGNSPNELNGQLLLTGGGALEWTSMPDSSPAYLPGTIAVTSGALHLKQRTGHTIGEVWPNGFTGPTWTIGASGYVYLYSSWIPANFVITGSAHLVVTSVSPPPVIFNGALLSGFSDWDGILQVNANNGPASTNLGAITTAHAMTLVATGTPEDVAISADIQCNSGCTGITLTDVQFETGSIRSNAGAALTITHPGPTLDVIHAGMLSLGTGLNTGSFQPTRETVFCNLKLNGAYVTWTTFDFWYSGGTGGLILGPDAGVSTTLEIGATFSLVFGQSGTPEPFRGLLAFDGSATATVSMLSNTAFVMGNGAGLMLTTAPNVRIAGTLSVSNAATATLTDVTFAGTTNTLRAVTGSAALNGTLVIPNAAKLSYAANMRLKATVTGGGWLDIGGGGTYAGPSIALPTTGTLTLASTVVISSFLLGANVAISAATVTGANGVLTVNAGAFAVTITGMSIGATTVTCDGTGSVTFVALTMTGNSNVYSMGVPLGITGASNLAGNFIGAASTSLSLAGTAAGAFAVQGSGFTVTVAVVGNLAGAGPVTLTDVAFSRTSGAITAPIAVGSAATTFTAPLDLTGSAVTFGSGFSVGGTGLLQLSTGAGNSGMGTITMPSGFVAGVSGVLTLTGAVDIANGAINVGGFSSAALTFGGGAFAVTGAVQLDGSTAFVPNLAFSGSAICGLTVTYSGSTTAPAVVFGAGTGVSDPATFTGVTTGSISTTGAVTLTANSAALQIPRFNAGAFTHTLSGANTVTLTGVTMASATTLTTAGTGLTIASSVGGLQGTIESTANAAVSVTGTVNAATTLAVTAATAGTMTLGGALTVTGASAVVTISGARPVSISGSASFTVNTGATLNLIAATVGGVTLNGGVTFAGAGTVTSSSGSGVLTLATGAGGAIVFADTLTVRPSQTWALTGSGSVTVGNAAPQAAVVYTATGGVTLSGNFTGSVSQTFGATGSPVISGATRALRVFGGTVAASSALTATGIVAFHSGTTVAAGAAVSGSGRLELYGGATVSGGSSGVLAAASVLFLGGATALTFDTAGGDITLPNLSWATGTVAVTGANNCMLTAVTMGADAVLTASASGATGTAIGGGALAGLITTTATANVRVTGTVGSGATLAVAPTGSGALTVTGSGTVTVANGGTLSVGGSGGSTSVSVAGTVSVSSGGAVVLVPSGASGAVTVSGALNAAAGSTVTGPTGSGAPAGVLTIDSSSADRTLLALSLGGTLRLIGSHTLTVTTLTVTSSTAAVVNGGVGTPAIAGAVTSSSASGQIAIGASGAVVSVGLSGGGQTLTIGAVNPSVVAVAGTSAVDVPSGSTLTVQNGAKVLGAVAVTGSGVVNLQGCVLEGFTGSVAAALTVNGPADGGSTTTFAFPTGGAAVFPKFSFGGVVEATGLSGSLSFGTFTMTGANAQFVTETPATIGTGAGSVLRGQIVLNGGGGVDIATGVVAASTALTVYAVGAGVVNFNGFTVTGALTLGDSLTVGNAGWTGTGTVALDGCTVNAISMPQTTPYVGPTAGKTTTIDVTGMQQVLPSLSPVAGVVQVLGTSFTDSLELLAPISVTGAVARFTRSGSSTLTATISVAGTALRLDTLEVHANTLVITGPPSGAPAALTVTGNLQVFPGGSVVLGTGVKLVSGTVNANGGGALTLDGCVVDVSVAVISSGWTTLSGPTGGNTTTIVVGASNTLTGLTWASGTVRYQAAGASMTAQLNTPTQTGSAQLLVPGNADVTISGGTVSAVSVTGAAASVLIDTAATATGAVFDAGAVSLAPARFTFADSTLTTAHFNGYGSFRVQGSSTATGLVVGANAELNVAVALTLAVQSFRSLIVTGQTLTFSGAGAAAFDSIQLIGPFAVELASGVTSGSVSLDAAVVSTSLSTGGDSTLNRVVLTAHSRWLIGGSAAGNNRLLLLGAGPFTSTSIVTYAGVEVSYPLLSQVPTGVVLRIENAQATSGATVIFLGTRTFNASLVTGGALAANSFVIGACFQGLQQPALPAYVQRNAPASGCPTPYDGCASSPCANGGTCTNGASTFTCGCANGFSGLICQTNINDCASQPCLHGGVCVDGAASYTCDCTGTGFVGAFCQNAGVVPCGGVVNGQPCSGHGVCDTTVTPINLCVCESAYAGVNCSESRLVDDSPTPVLNDGGIAGVSIGAIVFVALIVGGVYYVVVMRPSKRVQPAPVPRDTHAPVGIAVSSNGATNGSSAVAAAVSANANARANGNGTGNGNGNTTANGGVELAAATNASASAPAPGPAAVSAPAPAPTAGASGSMPTATNPDPENVFGASPQ